MILYPVFLNLIGHASNDYWKIVFRNLAEGICVNNHFRIENDCICYFIEGTKHSCDIPLAITDSSPEKTKETHDRIYQFLKKKIGVASHGGIDAALEHFYQQIKDEKQRRKEWKDITKRSEMEHYIKKFLYEKMTEQGLCSRDMRRIINRVFFTNQFKEITGRIKFCPDRKKIISIEGMSFVNGLLQLEE